MIENIKVITRHASARIAEFAFRYAKENGRKTVCAVHKATIMCVAISSAATAALLLRCTSGTGVREDSAFLKPQPLNSWCLLHLCRLFVSCRKISDGEFLNCCREAAKKYPEIKYEEMIIDNAMLQMALNPLRFDVMVMPNLYGDIGSGACDLVAPSGLLRFQAHQSAELLRNIRPYMLCSLVILLVQIWERVSSAAWA